MLVKSSKYPTAQSLLSWWLKTLPIWMLPTMLLNLSRKVVLVTLSILTSVPFDHTLPIHHTIKRFGDKLPSILGELERRRGWNAFLYDNISLTKLCQSQWLSQWWRCAQHGSHCCHPWRDPIGQCICLPNIPHPWRWRYASSCCQDEERCCWSYQLYFCKCFNHILFEVQWHASTKRLSNKTTSWFCRRQQRRDALHSRSLDPREPCECMTNELSSSLMRMAKRSAKKNLMPETRLHLATVSSRTLKANLTIFTMWSAMVKLWELLPRTHTSILHSLWVRSSLPRPASSLIFLLFRAYSPAVIIKIVGRRNLVLLRHISAITRIVHSTLLVAADEVSQLALCFLSRNALFYGRRLFVCTLILRALLKERCNRFNAVLQLWGNT